MSAVARGVMTAGRYGRRVVPEVVSASGHGGRAVEAVIPPVSLVRALVPIPVDPEVRVPLYRPRGIDISTYYPKVRTERKRARENVQQLMEQHYESYETFKKFPELLDESDLVRRTPVGSATSSSSFSSSSSRSSAWETRVRELMPHTLFPMWYQQANTLAATLHLGEAGALEDELTMLVTMNNIVDPMVRFARRRDAPSHWQAAMDSPLLSLAQPALNVIHVGTYTHILRDFPIAFAKTHATVGELPTLQDYGESYATVMAVSDVTAPAMQHLVGRNLWTATLDPPAAPLTHRLIFPIRNDPYTKAVRQYTGFEVEVPYPSDEIRKLARQLKLPPFGTT